MSKTAGKERSLLLSVSLCLVCLFGFSSMLHAQDEDPAPDEQAAENAVGEDGGEEGGALPAIYLPLKPTFVVNYGAAGRLRYLKTDVSVRLSSADAANSLRSHLPYVRNNLIMLFASQTNATVGSQVGKETIRSDALEVIRAILEDEDQVPREQVIEVFFNNFIVQK